MNFVSLFPETENVHLIKDVGMIPYVMKKNFNMNSYIAAYKNPELYYLNNEVKGLKKIDIDKFCSKSIINVSFYLIKKAKEIDVLNLYHLSKATQLWINIYKFFNKKGRVYLKLDTNYKVACELLRSPVDRYFIKRTLKKCNLISAETIDVKGLIEQKVHCSVEHIPNGVLKNSVKVFPKAKEKIIMSVGRLGTTPKNSELLIDSFIEAINYIDCEWKLYMVGPVTEEFMNYCKMRLDTDEKKRRVCFLGNITDRDELEELYVKCTVFAMPSRWEGFSLAGVEALAHGDYLLTSDLECFKEMTNDNRFGCTCENGNLKQYTDSLIEVCKNFEDKKNIVDYNQLISFVNDNYTWEKVCSIIYNKLIK